MTDKKVSKNSIHSRHQERRQRRIREQQIRRYTFFTVLGLILVLILMFFTPIFNIRSVNIEGTNKLTSQQITEQVGDYTGRNLFTTGDRRIKKNILKITYVEKVDVKKHIFPPSISIEITEYQPAVQFLFADSYVVIEKNGKIIEKSPQKAENVALCEGVQIVTAHDGEQIEFKDDEVRKVVMGCISNMEKAGILRDVTLMSFADLSNITFNYQSRLDVICGTNVDFGRKLALFKEAINSNKLTQNSRGTINLSTTGKAIWTP